MPAIHLIKNDRSLPRITPIRRGTNDYQSGFWALTEATARALIGGEIYFHERQTGPSFFGGIIKDAIKVEGGEYADRILFTFTSDQACKGVVTPRKGWAQEMKIVL